MKITAIVHARMSSRRLPGKTLKPILGKPLIQYLLERMNFCQEIDDWILATSVDGSDDPVEAFAKEAGFPCFRGPLDDVALRVLQAADQTQTDAVVRLSGDSPFLDQTVIDDGARLYREGKRDLITNVKPRTFPPGCSVEVLGVKMLRERWESIPEAEREHVTSHLYQDPSLTVDTAEEFEQAERILQAMTRPHTEYSIDEVVVLGRSLPTTTSNP